MCECRICQRAKKATDIIESLKSNAMNDAAEFIDSLMNDVEGAELDRDHCLAVIEGKWPDADKIIAAARTNT